MLKVIYLELTRECNLSCIHCSNSSSSPLSDELSPKEVRQVLKEINKLKGREVRIYGGEPFLRKDSILETAKIIKNYGLEVSIYSNGTIIDNNILRNLKEINPRILVSIDGASPKSHDKIRNSPGNFNIVLKNIEMLKSHNFKLLINFTVSRINQGEIYDVYKLANTLGLDGVKSNIITKLGRAIDNWHLLYLSPLQLKRCFIEINNAHKEFFKSTLNRRKCTAGIEYLFIASNGDVFPCPLFIDKQFCGGNIRNSSLENIWMNPRGSFLTLRKIIEKNKYCTNCKVDRGTCQGGCRSRAFHFYGDLYAPDPAFCISQ